MFIRKDKQIGMIQNLVGRIKTLNLQGVANLWVKYSYSIKNLFLFYIIPPRGSNILNRLTRKKISLKLL